MFPCIYEHCDDNFPDVKALTAHCVESHRRQHLRRFHCSMPNCSSSYKARSSVYKHMRDKHADCVRLDNGDTTVNRSNISLRRARKMPEPQNADLIKTGLMNTPIPPRERLDQFNIGKPLGRGMFGRVYLARDKESGLIVALKILFKSQMLKHKMEYLFVREIENQCHLRHENILRLYNYFFDDKKVYLILEYALGGQLYDLLREAERFCEARTALYIFQIADALNYCHSKDIIHRDIKPENILVGANGRTIKLADFGAAVHSKNPRNTMLGTLLYLSPEMVSGKDHDYRVDNWAVGVLCYEFLDGNTPFDHDRGNHINDDHLKRNIKYALFEYNDNFTKGSRDLISRLLVRNPDKRLSLEKVMDHVWIKQQLQLGQDMSFAVQ